MVTHHFTQKLDDLKAFLELVTMKIQHGMWEIHGARDSKGDGDASDCCGSRIQECLSLGDPGAIGCHCRAVGLGLCAGVFDLILNSHSSLRSVKPYALSTKNAPSKQAQPLQRLQPDSLCKTLAFCRLEPALAITKTEVVSVRVPPDVKAALNAAAEHERRSIASMVEFMVLEYCRARGIVARPPTKTARVRKAP